MSASETPPDATEPSRAPRRHRRVTGAAIASLAVLGLAGCGTGAQAQTPAAGSTSAPGATAGAQDDALMACLQQNGVPAPPDGGGPAGGQAGTPPTGTPPTGTPPTGTPPTGSASTGSAGGGQAGNAAAPPGVDADVWAKAQQACAPVAAESGAPAG